MESSIVTILEDAHVPWFHSSGNDGGPTVSGRGHALVGDRYLEGQALVDHVRTTCAGPDTDAAADAVKRLTPTFDGCWVLVVQWPDGRLLASTDRLRCIPLFYGSTPTEFVLAADIEPVKKRLGRTRIDERSAFEFLTVGYVTGENTLYEGIYQVLPSEWLEVFPGPQGPRITRSRYYRFYPTAPYVDTPEVELENELAAMLTDVFKPVGRWLFDDTVILPLSGGLDSRLIGAMLKKNGVRDVRCYSYGKAGNNQAAVSRQVAQALGYPWTFVEYTGAGWAEAVDSPRMHDFWRYCSKGVSLPVFQDYPAAIQVAQQPFPRAPLFYPGHSMDMLAGSHIPADYPVLQAGGKTVVEQVLKSHYTLWPLNPAVRKAELFQRVCEKIERLSQAPWGDQAANRTARFELWETENRQALFIVNSVRVFEFLGARWHVLWPYPLMEYFLKLPLPLRVRERIYINTLRKRVFVGKEAALSIIPSADLGVLRDPAEMAGQRKATPVQDALRAGLRQTLTTLHLRNFVHRLLLKPATDPLLFSWWFSHGRDPTSLTVGKALAHYQTLDKLPRSLHCILKPELDRRLDLGSCNGVLAAVALGEICAERA